MIHVEIANQPSLFRLDHRKLRGTVRRVLRGEGIADAEISVACVDDACIQRLNEHYLQHVGPTDVITFPLSAPGAALEGEIVLSVETAQRVARELGHGANDEVLLYLIHGLLHLCGYDDHSPAQRRRMRQRERNYLQHGRARLLPSGTSVEKKRARRKPRPAKDG
jgi:probable rRNA maturation factor